jgi:hypothetical protein
MPTPKTVKKKLTRWIRDRRVAICRDVLAQIKLEKINVTQGEYLISEIATGVDFDEKGDLCQVVDHLENCSVCARGALMLSKARLYDRVSLRNIYDAAENELSANSCEVYEALKDEFGDRYHSAEETLIAIMRNVIRNDGEFVIPKAILAKVES